MGEKGHSRKVEVVKPDLDTTAAELVNHLEAVDLQMKVKELHSKLNEKLADEEFDMRPR